LPWFLIGFSVLVIFLVRHSKPIGDILPHPEGIPENIERLIFAHIDSVEQIEVILLLKAQPEKWWTPEAISGELRTNPKSIQSRLSRTRRLRLFDVQGNAYRYSPKDPAMGNLIDELADCYRIRKHKILELIFSPAKRARNFADAFAFGKKSDSTEGDENG
jgi:hypothetical protein